MRNVLVAIPTVLFSLCANSWADVRDAPKRTMPHQEECAEPLPTDFWDGPAAKPFRSTEAWAWNERICLGRWADMRNAPGGSGQGEECQPAEIEKKGEAVPAQRRIRPEFLELILSHEPWASVPRHPQVVIQCALVSGDVDLDDHEITPTFGLHQSKLEGNVSLLGTRLNRSLSFRGSTVTGKLNADGLEIEGGLFLNEGAVFRDIDLVGARIRGNAEFTASTVTGLLNASDLKVEGGVYLRRGGRFAEIILHGAKVGGTAEFSGSTVTRNLGADRLHVGGGLFLRDGGSFQNVSLFNARINGDMEVIGSKVAGTLTADRAVVGGRLILRNGAFAGIRLMGTRVSGDVDLIGATVTGEFQAESLETEGNLFVGDGGTLGEMYLIGTRISGNAFFAGAILTGKLDADGLEVGSNLNMTDGKFSDIDLIGAKVVGQANVSRSTISGKLLGDSVEVGGGLFLRNGGTYSEISLVGARIGRVVHLAGSTFNGGLDLTGVTINGELHLSSGSLERSPNWGDGASLVLRNAMADALQAQGNSWQLSGRRGLLPTELTGFVFNTLGGLDNTGAANMGDESAEWLISWIEAQQDHGDTYDPQPYTQLAGVLEAAGATDKAKAIRYAKFEHKRDHDASMNVLDRFWLALGRCLVGYGVYPIWAIYWFVGLVAAGGLLVQFSKASLVRGGMGFWYSLENALPLIVMKERFKDVDHGRAWLVHCLQIQKIFGFLLATFWVGALALLSG